MKNSKREIQQSEVEIKEGWDPLARLKVMKNQIRENSGWSYKKPLEPIENLR